jgi:perosamine synthetase
MHGMEKPMNESPLMEVGEKNIVLFHPHIPKNASKYVADTLSTRWIGQGPKVDDFESRFSKMFANGNQALSVGSGTDALHLAYMLADLKAGDEVVVPAFTCTATNIPFLYMGVKIKFADVQQGTLNIDPEHVSQLVNEKTKAIVCVHYGGLPCDLKELNETARKFNIPVIEDAAHALGATYNGIPIGAYSAFTMFSFQAIKHITTGDGGMLTFKDDGVRSEKGKRLRWFGIDRSAKQMGIWENDITEVGYKYQMNDVAASMGLAALEEFDEILSHRKQLFTTYESGLQNIPGVKFIGGGYKDREHGAWLCTVLANDRENLQRKLRENNVESSQVHYRNDRYSIFGGRRSDLPNMDEIEDKYLVLPLHTKMSTNDVDRVCEILRTGW